LSRLPLILLAVAALAVLGLLSSIISQGFEELTRAEEEQKALELRKEELEKSISELESTLDAVRSSPEAVESMARRELGWVRPGDRVILLATPTPVPTPPSLTGPTPTPILALPD
jgi:cell division protein FtsB